MRISLYPYSVQIMIKKKHLVDGIAESKYITQRGNSLYIDSISPLSLPQDFAEAFVAGREGSGEEG